MRHIIAFAAAPLALALAACGSNQEAADDDAVVADTTMPTGQMDYPAVATNARTSVNYGGTYAQKTPDGRTRTVELGANDSYTITDENGVKRTGTYNWYSDNSRILIDSDGKKEVYAIADGALYRLADENAPTTGTMTEDVTYRRTAGPGGTMGVANNTSDGSVQDVPGQ